MQTVSTAITPSTPVVSSRRNWLVRSRAWLGILILAPFFTLALLSQPLSFEGSWLDWAFDCAAWIVFLCGGALRWWATLYIGGRKRCTLVSDGPYSMCRNPLYLGTFMMNVALCIFLESLTLGFGLMLASIFYLTVTVPAEERTLTEKLGEPYLEYCRRVPRFWPRWSIFRTPSAIEVNIDGLVAEGWRTTRWLWVPLAGELLAQLRAETWWPHFLHLP